MFSATDPWTFLLLNYVIHSTILIAMAAILVRVRPFAQLKIREHLWKFALIGGIVTALFQSYSDLNFFEISPLTATESSTGGILIEDDYQPLGNEGFIPDFETSLPLENEVRLSFLSRWKAPWIALIPTLSLLLIGRLLFARQMFLRALQMRVIEDQTVNTILDELIKTSGFRQDVTLYTTRHLKSPVALSKNRICIPEALLEGLDIDQIRSLLAHELAHLQRKDPQWLLFINLISKLLFFQPLNRLVRNKLQFIMENAADQEAVKLTGDKAVFTETLLTVARWNNGTRLPVHALGFANSHALKQRVNTLLKKEEPQSRINRWHLSLMAFLLLGLVGFISPEISEHKDPRSSEVTEVVSEFPQASEITRSTAERISLPPHLQALSSVKNAALWSKPSSSTDLSRAGSSRQESLPEDNPQQENIPPVEQSIPNLPEVGSIQTSADQESEDEQLQAEARKIDLVEMARLRHVNYEQFKGDFWPMLVASGLLKKRINTVELTYKQLHINGKPSSEASIQPFRRLIETHFPESHWGAFQYKRERFKVDDIKKSIASTISNDKGQMASQLRWKARQKQDKWRDYRAELALNLLNDGVIETLSENISIKWRKSKVLINGKKFTGEDFFKYRSIKNKYFPSRAV